MAAGLTLLDDAVKIAVLGGLDDTQAVRDQLDVLEFAEVPIGRYGERGVEDPALAVDIIGAHAVYIV